MSSGRTFHKSLIRFIGICAVALVGVASSSGQPRAASSPPHTSLFRQSDKQHAAEGAQLAQLEQGMRPAPLVQQAYSIAAEGAVLTESREESVAPRRREKSPDELADSEELGQNGTMQMIMTNPSVFVADPVALSAIAKVIAYAAGELPEEAVLVKLRCLSGCATRHHQKGEPPMLVEEGPARVEKPVVAIDWKVNTHPGKELDSKYIMSKVKKTPLGKAKRRVRVAYSHAHGMCGTREFMSGKAADKVTEQYIKAGYSFDLIVKEAASAAKAASGGPGDIAMAAGRAAALASKRDGKTISSIAEITVKTVREYGGRKDDIYKTVALCVSKAAMLAGYTPIDAGKAAADAVKAIGGKDDDLAGADADPDDADPYDAILNAGTTDQKAKTSFHSRVAGRHAGKAAIAAGMGPEEAAEAAAHACHESGGLPADYISVAGEAATISALSACFGPDDVSNAAADAAESAGGAHGDIVREGARGAAEAADAQSKTPLEVAMAAADAAIRLMGSIEEIVQAAADAAGRAAKRQRLSETESTQAIVLAAKMAGGSQQAVTEVAAMAGAKNAAPKQGWPTGDEEVLVVADVNVEGVALDQLSKEQEAALVEFQSKQLSKALGLSASGIEVDLRIGNGGILLSAQIDVEDRKTADAMIVGKLGGNPAFNLVHDLVQFVTNMPDMLRAKTGVKIGSEGGLVTHRSTSTERARLKSQRQFNKTKKEKSARKELFPQPSGRRRYGLSRRKNQQLNERADSMNGSVFGGNDTDILQRAVFSRDGQAGLTICIWLSAVVIVALPTALLVGSCWLACCLPAKPEAQGSGAAASSSSS